MPRTRLDAQFFGCGDVQLKAGTRLRAHIEFLWISEHQQLLGILRFHPVSLLDPHRPTALSTEPDPQRRNRAM